MEDAWLESLGVFISALPFVVFALAAGMMGSGLLVVAPTVFVKGVGVVSNEQVRQEKNKLLFGSMLFVSFVMFAMTWWFFTQAELVIASANQLVR